MDMLLSTGEQESVALTAMAVQALGVEAVSFTGGQIGIVTDSSHTKARIRHISTDRMRAALDAGKIIIACGFQGVDEDLNITTLGRGGSDSTAAALAAVLDAAECEIYTDVEGVFTTDPRLVKSARKIDHITYDEMLELASLGAGVMHSRSIEFAKKYRVPLRVRPAYSDGEGTLISSQGLAHPPVVTGVALVRNEARVSLCRNSRPARRDELDLLANGPAKNPHRHGRAGRGQRGPGGGFVHGAGKRTRRRPHRRPDRGEATRLRQGAARDERLEGLRRGQRDENPHRRRGPDVFRPGRGGTSTSAW